MYFSDVSVCYHVITTFSEGAIQYVYMLRVQRVSKIVRQNSGVSEHTKTGKNIMDICGHKQFSRYR